MPCWFYELEDLKNTPSMKDGIDEGNEARYRREGARFIIEAGTVMKLRYDTMATGVVYFHRFYMFHSFKEFPRYVTGAACLFLAGKVEETPKKCKDIIRISKEILAEHHFAAFGDDPKEEIMTYERILLQTIKFDLQVEHPYSYLLKYAKTFKGDKEKIQKLVQMAWTFVNDSLCTTLCLQWEPHITAVAFLYLAGRLSKSDLLDWSGKSTKVKWWESLSEDVSLDIMEDVCHNLLDLYAAGKKGAQGGQGKAPKRSKQKSSPTADADKPKEEPRVKQSKVEQAEKSTPPPPPPPTVKAKASTSSSSSSKPATTTQHAKPVTAAPSYKDSFPQTTNPIKASTSGTSSQSITPAATIQGSYSTTLPQQTYTVAPPVFTGTMTPPKLPPSTQSQFFTQSTEQVTMPVIPSAPPVFTQSAGYTNPAAPLAPTIPQVPTPTAQYQPPLYSTQFPPSAPGQDYSVPPPVIPSASLPTAVSTQGAGTSSGLYSGSGTLHSASGGMSGSGIHAGSGMQSVSGLHSGSGLHSMSGMHSSSGIHSGSGLHAGSGLRGVGPSSVLDVGSGMGPNMGMGLGSSLQRPTRPHLQPPMKPDMSQAMTGPPPRPLLPRTQRPLTPTRQMLQTPPAAPIPPSNIPLMDSQATDTPPGFPGRKPINFGNFSTPPPLMSLPVNRPPKPPSMGLARVPGRSMLQQRGAMPPGPGMWGSDAEYQ